MADGRAEQGRAMSATERTHLPTAGEIALQIFVQDTPETVGSRKVSVGSGGSATYSFLRQVFAGGLPSGFGIAEVGVWHGDTSVLLAELLPDDGFLHIFDYDPIVQSTKRRLADAGYTNVSAFGCSMKSRDSYNWSLMKLIASNPLPIYDYIFLDGSHTWDIDGLAFLLLDRLLKPGGFMDFDDYGWTMADSPTLNPTVSPHILDWFTAEQIQTPHVALIVELLAKRDNRYKEIISNKIFRKITA
jgi:hypothetical protein